MINLETIEAAKEAARQRAITLDSRERNGTLLIDDVFDLINMLADNIKNDMKNEVSSVDEGK